jgi:hypothetical protein
MKFLAMLLLSVFLAVPTFTPVAQAHNVANRLKCNAVKIGSSERSDECVKMIYEAVSQRFLVKKTNIRAYQFLDEDKSKLMREFYGEGLLGVYLEGRIYILMPTQAFPLPVEQVIAHEITHAFQIANSAPPNEEQARDVASLVWLELFD